MFFFSWTPLSLCFFFQSIEMHFSFSSRETIIFTSVRISYRFCAPMSCGIIGNFWAAESREFGSLHATKIGRTNMFTRKNLENISATDIEKRARENRRMIKEKNKNESPMNENNTHTYIYIWRKKRKNPNDDIISGNFFLRVCLDRCYLPRAVICWVFSCVFIFVIRLISFSLLVYK